jgi:hypothetical protein
MKKLFFIITILLIACNVNAAATFTVNGSNTTVDFAYTAPTSTVQSIVTSAAHYAWYVGGDHGSDTFPTGNQAKLNILDAFIKAKILEWAAQYDIIMQTDAARNAAEISTKQTYTMQ